MKLLSLILSFYLLSCTAPRDVQGKVILLTVTKIEGDYVKVEDGQGLSIWLMIGRDVPFDVKEGDHYKYVMIR